MKNVIRGNELGGQKFASKKFGGKFDSWEMLDDEREITCQRRARHRAHNRIRGKIGAVYLSIFRPRKPAGPGGAAKKLSHSSLGRASAPARVTGYQLQAEYIGVAARLKMSLESITYPIKRAERGRLSRARLASERNLSGQSPRGVRNIYYEDARKYFD